MPDPTDAPGGTLGAGLHRAIVGAGPLALLHGLGAGSDSPTTWLRGLAIVCVAVVGASLAWRVLVLDEPDEADADRPAGRVAA